MNVSNFQPETQQIGNALVCLAVYTNHSMRTVTNIFIVNLAVADFLVILLCLPPTVLWDVTETWFFGEMLCKSLIYFQVRCYRLGLIILILFTVQVFVYTARITSRLPLIIRQKYCLRAHTRKIC